MAWSGFIAVGTVTAGVFTDSGITRQAWTFTNPNKGVVEGAGSTPAAFGAGPITVNACAFYPTVSGGTPDLVYPFAASRTIEAGLNLSLLPSHVAVDYVNGQTLLGVALDIGGAQKVAGLASVQSPSVDAARAPYTGIQNVKLSNTLRTATALARVRQGLGSASFGFVGDSFTRGQGSSATLNQLFVNALPKQISERLPTSLNPQWQSGFGTGTSSAGTLFTNDSRFTQTGGFTGSTLSVVGGLTLGTTTAGSMTFTPLTKTTKCDIWYLQNTTGVFSWQIDGGAATQVNQAGAKAVVKVTIGSGAAANHAYTLNWVSGNVQIIGMNAYDDTASRLDMFNFGRGGAASNYYDNVTDPIWSALPILVDFACDTYFVGLMCNDWWVSAQNIAVPQYIINMQVIITALKAVGDVVLYSEITQDPSIATPAKQQTYVDALRGLAMLNDLPFIDVWTLFGSFATANGLGLMADTFHPSAMGNSVAAGLFLKFINAL